MELSRIIQTLDTLNQYVYREILYPSARWVDNQWFFAISRECPSMYDILWIAFIVNLGDLFDYTTSRVFHVFSHVFS